MSPCSQEHLNQTHQLCPFVGSVMRGERVVSVRYRKESHCGHRTLCLVKVMSRSGALRDFDASGIEVGVRGCGHL